MKTGCSRWSTVQLLFRDVTRRGVHAGLPAAAGGALAPIQAHDLALERGALHGSARRYGVPASVVAAILHVESGCGHYTGRSLLLPGLARLAMANEPANVDANVDRLAGDDPAVALQVRARARYLEDTFYPEVRALFTVAARLHVDPLDLRGSASGAFGYPQFLPTSFLRFGVDADGDGRVSLYEMPDASASCAHFLASHGWHPGLTVAQRRRVIWQYNRSDAYIDAVLTIARRIDTPESAPTALAHRSVKRHVVAARRPHRTPHRPAHARSHATGR